MNLPSTFKLNVKNLQMPPFLTNKIFMPFKKNPSLNLTSNEIIGKSRPTTTHNLKFKQEHPLKSRVIRKNKTNIPANFTEENYNLLLNNINNTEEIFSKNTTYANTSTNKTNKSNIKNKRIFSASSYIEQKTNKKKFNFKKYNNSISNNILVNNLPNNIYDKNNVKVKKNPSEKELNEKQITYNLTNPNILANSNIKMNSNENINNNDSNASYNKWIFHQKHLSCDNKYIYINSDNIKERKKDVIVENNDDLLKEFYSQTINNFNNKYHLKYKTTTERNQKEIKIVFSLLNQFKYQEERKNNLIKYLRENSKLNKKNFEVKSEKERKSFFPKSNKLLNKLFFRYNKFYNYKTEPKNISIQTLNWLKSKRVFDN